MGSLIVLAFLVIAIAAPVIAPPADPESPETLPRDGFGPFPEPPNPSHPLGLMSDKYDVFYGLIWGTRVAFRFGLIVTLIRALTGVVLGLVAGYYGGLADAVLMRITDAFLAFPVIVPVMVMLALFGHVSYESAEGRPIFLPDPREQTVIVALILFGWMSYARLIRGNVLAEREKDYMKAARATGVRKQRILFRHLLPNATHGLFVLMASDVGAVVVLIAAFTFIGLIGATFGKEMQADWGQMLAASRNWIVGSPAGAFEYWYTYLPASAAIVLFSIGWNLIGDGLRDVFDPRTRRGYTGSGTGR
jgi:peptide/nickel transport system permease protein